MNIDIDIDARAERGRQLHKQGYNCAQSVVLALCDLVGWSEETATQVAAPFGRGISGMKEVCGCVTGMALLASQMIKVSEASDMAARSRQQALVQQMAAEFREQNGDIICRRLLGIEGGEGIVRKSCTEKVADAVRIAAAHMQALSEEVR